jgi:hypothetical protein
MAFAMFGHAYAETSRLLLPILVHISAPGIEGHMAELPVSPRQHLAGAYDAYELRTAGSV